MKRKIAAAAVAIGVLAGPAGCGDPDQQMLTEGARAAREAASEVRTARLAAQSLLDHKVWPQPATVVVTDAEQAIGTVASAFDQRQPGTDESRQTYDQYSDALVAAQDGVTELRIALHRDDLAAVAQQVDQLGRTADQLVRLGERAK
ncbi:hypothetical protein GCM10009789_23120 [Kribbella sancticallisti]|uniref:Lipoprotein n=1 Tax=Kribbella sancticallisti TaxID=460087 RepID=A0ABN2D3G9_9ACTN